MGMGMGMERGGGWSGGVEFNSGGCLVDEEELV